ncbi:hypothetical protein [Streptomonospora salina]|uniref:Uncharacterized protein n=1 Tax=Streptomonospora salina TaxID=104205 RepID=A0A841E8E9_9ACTN|nr:hypothetical protein [Streptomonospora salina]MBB6000247.1 hypothetical protein [Streptomonospora salina]
MSCTIRDACDGARPDDLFCDACVSTVVDTLREAPALLRLLEAETPKTLARPTDAPVTRSGFGSSTPASEHFIDLTAAITDAVADWSALTGRPAARTVAGIASAASRLAARPHRHLAALGALGAARALLRAVRSARRALALAVEPRQLGMQCPGCGTRGLTQLTEDGPVSCDYCDAEFPPNGRPDAAPSVENTFTGEVEGEVTQTGHGGEDSAQSVRNSVSGTVRGRVVQAGNVSGGIRL